ncbi:MAG: hypothetical protein HYW79_02425 [Parcubacteria group bacterium]|nr:hypothetical protein [Parcubacteria group bacterium]
MNIIAIIPARGGSKGVPGKNIRNFCGKPLIAWAIETALKSRLISATCQWTHSLGLANALTATRPSKFWKCKISSRSPRVNLIYTYILTDILFYGRFKLSIIAPVIATSD